MHFTAKYIYNPVNYIAYKANYYYCTAIIKNYTAKIK